LFYAAGASGCGGGAIQLLKGLGAYYGERLRSVFPIVAPNPSILRSSGKRPLFQLFFAAANAGRGGQIALRIAEHILKKI